MWWIHVLAGLLKVLDDFGRVIDRRLDMQVIRRIANSCNHTLGLKAIGEERVLGHRSEIAHVANQIEMHKTRRSDTN